MLTKEQKREYANKYYHTHKEQIRKNQLKYEATHQEEIKARRKIQRLAKAEKRSEYNKKYRLEHPESGKAAQKKYCESHREKLRERDKKYWAKNKEKKKLYREKNIEKIRTYKIEYNANNKAKREEYYALHKEEILARTTQYDRQRRKTDPIYRMKGNMRTRIGIMFRKMKINKPVNTEKLLGASYDIVQKHIEEQFTEGMSWEKIGKEIHIDHIIPLASAKDIDELIALCHYSNLQPLWAKDNLTKHKKIDWEPEELTSK